jgi:hypothetical protein
MNAPLIILSECNRPALKRNGYGSGFLPLTLTRAVFDLLFGVYTKRERLTKRLSKHFNLSVNVFFVRPELVNTMKEKVSSDQIVSALPAKDTCLNAHNGRAVLFFGDSYIDEESFLLIMNEKENVIFEIEGKPVAITSDSVSSCLSETSLLGRRFRHKEVKGFIPSGIWDLPAENGNMITRDIREFSPGTTMPKDLYPGVITTKTDDISTGHNVRIEPFVSIDATDGPVFIDSEVTIRSFSSIKGPVFIGDNTDIFFGQIKKGCSIGRVCKIGTEIEHSIIQGFSNIPHSGYTGHSFIGEWCLYRSYENNFRS